MKFEITYVGVIITGIFVLGLLDSLHSHWLFGH